MARPTTPESSFSNHVPQIVGRLIGLREMRGMSQAEAARRAVELGHPTHRSTITRIESGERRPTVEDLFALAAVYRVSPTELLQSSEEEFQQAVSDFTQAEVTEALDEASTAIEQAARAVAQARKGVTGD